MLDTNVFSGGNKLNMLATPNDLPNPEEPPTFSCSPSEFEINVDPITQRVIAPIESSSTKLSEKSSFVTLCFITAYDFFHVSMKNLKASPVLRISVAVLIISAGYISSSVGSFSSDSSIKDIISSVCLPEASTNSDKSLFASPAPILVFSANSLSNLFSLVVFSSKMGTLLELGG